MARESLLFASLLVAAQCSCLAQYVPPTQAERNTAYLKSLVNPLALVAAAAGSGISQWRDTPHEWGQGGGAYALRFVNSYGYHFVRQTMMYGASSLLDEDNRYFPCPRSGAKTRMRYAIESNFLARHADGSRHFSYSWFGATLGTAALSRVWQPASTRAPQNIASSFGIAVAVQVGFRVAHEFVPFMRHR